MFKRIFRRRRSASANPLRRALHGTAVSLSSAAFGYGTTFIPGVDAPAAAGLGLGALPVLLAFFPVPPRDGSDTAVEHQEPGSDADGTDPEQPADGDDTAPSALSSHADAIQEAADSVGSTCDASYAAGTAGLKDTPPADSAQRQPDEGVMVWEPRFEIKPRVTVHPVTFEQAVQADAPTPPADSGEPRVEPGKAS
ncbi:hypothetical protein G3I77_39040 [Streptomyces sp. D2-8]|uniref:hypothetical protein n=1 Tax=Streptomyces sp. D2-8 TaxID=2707767 RepID=UPI0020C001EB|nr:hypothetical protein [Streptomyces sp. D2-8]MCK8438770.1 hypothetical protein [Streptomyces sp. D2-8]